MGKAILSQDEINDLLYTISSIDLDENQTTRNVQEFDSNHSCIFSENQIKQVETLFTQLAKNMTKHFASVFNDLCHFGLSSVDVLTFEDYIRSLQILSPVYTVSWFGENLVIQIDPSISSQFLYGELMQKIGKIDWCQCRNLTRLESENLKRVAINPLLLMLKENFEERRKMFSNRLISSDKKENDTKTFSFPKEISFQNNTTFVDAAKKTDMCVIITIESKLFEEDGMINICIPLSFFQNVLLNNGVISGKESKTEFSFTCESSNCAVSIGQFLLQPNEKLKTGDLIKLDKTKNEPVDLFDKKTGKVIAKGDVCLIDEKFAIHINEVL